LRSRSVKSLPATCPGLNGDAVGLKLGHVGLKFQLPDLGKDPFACRRHLAIDRLIDQELRGKLHGAGVVVGASRRASSERQLDVTAPRTRSGILLRYDYLPKFAS
jgi:hypothetical protein